MAEAQIAVLIDYENVGLGSIQYLFDQLSDVGRIIVKRAYADWTAKGKLRDQVLELGVEAVHHFRASGSGKNSSDIHLVVDAVELLYTSPVDHLRHRLGRQRLRGAGQQAPGLREDRHRRRTSGRGLHHPGEVLRPVHLPERPGSGGPGQDSAADPGPPRRSDRTAS